MESSILNYILNTSDELSGKTADTVKRVIFFQSCSNFVLGSNFTERNDTGGSELRFIDGNLEMSQFFN